MTEDEITARVRQTVDDLAAERARRKELEAQVVRLQGECNVAQYDLRIARATLDEIGEALGCGKGRVREAGAAAHWIRDLVEARDGAKKERDEMREELKAYQEAARVTIGAIELKPAATVIPTAGRLEDTGPEAARQVASLQAALAKERDNAVSKVAKLKHERDEARRSLELIAEALGWPSAGAGERMTMVTEVQRLRNITRTMYLFGEVAGAAVWTAGAKGDAEAASRELTEALKLLEQARTPAEKPEDPQGHYITREQLADVMLTTYLAIAGATNITGETIYPLIDRVHDGSFFRREVKP